MTEEELAQHDSKTLLQLLLSADARCDALTAERDRAEDELYELQQTCITLRGENEALTAVQPAHVNETPKSEHVPGDVLMLTAERDRLAAAVDAVMADRKRILEERDRGFVMVMERAERAEAEVARLTALLPHPGETDDEVMWRSFQRGVSLAELAKAAGVTKERARLKLRKAEARGIRYE